eukprot:Blabericola_migrator_1__11629@NODE_69_length_15356_cov_75_151481_g62_i0_p1_GENE_NODE_69_length_15356_cov_75_151481_g62_i0NODE_69_length_15356_cov_75_151481_g62_i0_p1_ORF_typecomplete_len1208_score244_48UCH/PF00443_29/1_8e57UCH_1/PF13423_6/4_1e10UCH_1/PF13423_6/1_1e03Chlam_OMP3/PF03503_13/9_9e03Chlam_OMP3/PF03503_13/0_27_NODE_69_length_15356_cov_75_151481_g62_i0867012293
MGSDAAQQDTLIDQQALLCIVYNVDITSFLSQTKLYGSFANPFSLPVPSKKLLRTSLLDVINEVLEPPPSNVCDLIPQRQRRYIGLKNLGASCYMNAYLQCLYLNYTFRQTLYRVWDVIHSEPKVKKEDEGSPVKTEAAVSTNQICLDELAKLFATLQCGAVTVGDPSGMAKALCVSGRSQEDATELASMLLSKLESELKANKQPLDLVEIYQGLLEHSVICSECEQVSSRYEQFTELRVQSYPVQKRVRRPVETSDTESESDSETEPADHGDNGISDVNRKRVEPRKREKSARSCVTSSSQAALSLETLILQLFRKEVLRKQNQYQCETCGKKVDADKVIRIKEFPQYLQICFERCQFDPSSTERMKVLTPIQFPLELDMAKYGNYERGRPLSRRNRLNPHQYELVAVLEHLGHSATSGHYRAKVRDFGGACQQTSAESPPVPTADKSDNSPITESSPPPHETEESPESTKAGLLGGEKRFSFISSTLSKRRRFENNEDTAVMEKYHHRAHQKDMSGVVAANDASWHEWLEFDDTVVSAWSVEDFASGSTHLVSESAYLFVYKSRSAAPVEAADWIPASLKSLTDTQIAEAAKVQRADQERRQMLLEALEQLRSCAALASTTLETAKQETWRQHRGDLLGLLDAYTFVSSNKLQAILTGLYPEFWLQPFSPGIKVTLKAFAAYFPPDSAGVLEAEPDERQRNHVDSSHMCGHGKISVTQVLTGQLGLMPTSAMKILGLKEGESALEAMCMECAKGIQRCAVILIEIHHAFMALESNVTVWKVTASDVPSDEGEVFGTEELADQSDACVLMRHRVFCQWRSLMTMTNHVVKKKRSRTSSQAQRHVMIEAIQSVCRLLVQNFKSEPSKPLNLDHKMCCPHGVLIINRKLKTVKIPLANMEHIVKLEKKYTGALSELLAAPVSPRFNLGLSSECVLKDCNAPDPCADCQVSPLPYDNRKILQSSLDARHALPPGYSAMLMNPRYFVLADMLKVSRRSYRCFPAEGHYYAVRPDVLDRILSDTPINPGPPDFSVMESIGEYFRGLEAVQSKQWWQHIFHSFAADLPVGSAEHVEGGYLVYNMGLHTEMSVALVPREAIDVLVQKETVNLLKVAIQRNQLKPLDLMRVSQMCVPGDTESPALQVINVSSLLRDVPSDSLALHVVLAESKPYESASSGIVEIVAVQSGKFINICVYQDETIEYVLISFVFGI